jgi:PIN domain-containing protein
MLQINTDYDVLTIDTNILRESGYKFSSGLLHQLEQFKGSSLKIVQSDIVHQEATRHISSEILKTQKNISSALKSAPKHLGIPERRIQFCHDYLELTIDAKKTAEKRLTNFYKRIGATLLNSADYLDSTKLIQSYFKTESPFEEKQDKKNEFPDAIALISLEEWAKREEIQILAVSNDKGWKAYCENSENISLATSLPESFKKLIPAHIITQEIITAINTSVESGDSNPILDSIAGPLEDIIANTFPEIDASSSYYYEDDESYLEYVSHKLAHNGDNGIELNPILVQEEEIILQLSAEITFNAYTSFYFYAYDSIDKDNIPIGKLSAESQPVHAL